MRTTMKQLIFASLFLSTTLLAAGSAYATPLYFPHVDTSLPWQTEIAVINTGDQTVTGTLRALSDDGQLVDTKAVTLPARGRTQITVADEFTNPTDIGYIIFDTNSAAVQGYTKFYIAGYYRAAIPAVKDINTSDIYIPHIASNAQWWTGVSLVNTTSATKELTITFNNGQSVPYTLNANEHKVFTISSLFNNQSQPDIQSAVITHADGVIGVELFGSTVGGNRMDGILLTDKTASTLYYPHVASNDLWWTGIAAYNPSDLACTITITPYSDQGALLSTSTLPIVGKGKYVGAVADLGLPAQTSWFKIDATRPLTGFELFGTVSGNQLAAYAGGDETGSLEGVFPKIEKNGGWTGIAFVNTEDSTASVTLAAYNDNGNTVATQALLPVGGHAKVVNLAEALFSQDISGATYIAYASDRNVVGFQLNGTSDGTMLDGLPALAGSGTPAPVWQHTAGPEGGAISSLAIDPANSQVVFAGTWEGGYVFKTTNGGASWTAMNTGLTDSRIQSLAIDRTNSQTVYAGTNGGGVFKTTDGGASWTAMNTGLTDYYINSLAIDPANSQIVYAGTGGGGGGNGGDAGDVGVGGVFKTTDGGASWKAIYTGLTNTQVSSLAIDPANSQIVYAGYGSGSGSGVLKTTNGGASWSAINTGLTNSSVLSLVIDPANSQIVYAGNSSGGVFKTINGGASWTAIYTGLTNTVVQSLVIDPANSRTVYAGNSSGGVFKTTDGGASWTAINTGITNTIVSSLVIDRANSQIVYAGTYSGVFKTTNSGGSWSAINTGLTNTVVQSLVIDRANSQIVYAGTYSGIFKTINGGASWMAINTGLTNSIVRSLVIDRADSQIVYAGTTTGGVFKTINGGASWTAINTGLTNMLVYSLAIDPANSQIVYVATGGGGVFKTTDGGASWTAINTGLTNSIVRSLAIDRANSQIVYAGTEIDGSGISRGVFKTTNGGASWTAMNNGLPNSDGHSLAIDPANSQIVYAGTGGGVFKTTDGGASWTAINTGLTNTYVYSLAIDPSNSRLVYAGTYGGGVFRTTNGGASWTAINTGLTNSLVYSLAIDPANSRIVYTGTWGGSVFKTME